MKIKNSISLICHYLLPIIAITLLAFLTSGCATIFSSKKQELKIQPVGAQLEIYSWDGRLITSAKSESDITVTVDRPHSQAGGSYLIRLQKEGYCPRYWLENVDVSPLLWVDFFMGLLTFPIGVYIIWGIDGMVSFDGSSGSGAGISYAPAEFQLNPQGAQQCGF